MFDWNDLRVFLEVARAGTLSGAARRLGVDQSTVGRRLAALERAAGARLFDRRRDGYLLNASGEAVLESAGAVEAHAIAVERKLAGRDERPEGDVRIATSESFAVWFLIQQLPTLRQRLPAVRIELITGNPAVDLAKREADIALRLSKPTQPQLLARRLARGAWAVYASLRYLAAHGAPDPRKKFVGHDVLHYAGDLGETVGGRWLRENASRGQRVFASNSLLSQASAVSVGLGVSALPCVIGDVDASLRRIAPGVVGSHDLWLVVHPDLRQSVKVRAVMDYLAECVSAESALLAGKRPLEAPSFLSKPPLKPVKRGDLTRGTRRRRKS